MDKEPFVASGKYGASSTDPKTWCDFTTALDAYNDESRGFAGIGFVFTVESGIVGLDFDHCIHDGVIGDVTAADKREISALEIIESLGTYTEVSPSSDGLHAFCFGVKPGSAAKRGDVEMYDKGRFFTVTGNRVGTVETVAQCDLTGVYEAFFGTDEPETQAPPPPPSEPLGISDADILKLACAAKNGGRFSALYAGNWEGYYNSHSEADSALCFDLAFWFQRDPFAMDRVFRTSGLMRSKWDEARGEMTYGQKTIQSACEKCQNVYTPSGSAVLLRSPQRVAAHIRGEADAGQSEDAPAESDEGAMDAGIYAVLNGRTIRSIKKRKTNATGADETDSHEFVSDFVASITGEVRTEEGVASYEVQGLTRFGRCFRVALDASKMADARYVAGQFLNSMGAGVIIYAGAEKHIGPAVHQFTDRSRIQQTRLFERTGWTNDLHEFIIPGMEAPDMDIHLDRALPYRVETHKSEHAADDLEMLLQSHLDTITPVVISHLFAAPISRLAGLQDEKFAVFTVGRSGTLKTSFHQAAMCVYGDFAADDKLLKLGAGGTLNAMMSYPAAAADLTLLFDNFKPGTGTGQRDATSLVHGLMEGTERKRLNRDGTHRVAKELRCFLQFTGEDTISDAASVARMLILNAHDPGTECIAALSQSQANAHRLPAIGGVFLKWLMTTEARELVGREAATLGARRSIWVQYLRAKSSEMINAMRVATSLSFCQISWAISCQHPIFGPVLKRWQGRFDAALVNCAGDMARYSAQSHEANRYIETLRSLIVSEKAYLQPRHSDAIKEDRRAFIGWEDGETDETDNIYILPDAAYNAVLDALRNHPFGLNGLGQNTISKQLDQLGYLTQKDGANYAVKRLLGTTRTRVLIMPRARFFDDENEGDEEAAD